MGGYLGEAPAQKPTGLETPALLYDAIFSAPSDKIRELAVPRAHPGDMPGIERGVVTAQSRAIAVAWRAFAEEHILHPTTSEHPGEVPFAGAGSITRGAEPRGLDVPRSNKLPVEHEFGGMLGRRSGGGQQGQNGILGQGLPFRSFYQAILTRVAAARQAGASPVARFMALVIVCSRPAS